MFASCLGKAKGYLSADCMQWPLHLPCTGHLAPMSACAHATGTCALAPRTLCLFLQGGSEKLSDEAIEETLEKVVRLLAYISDKDLFAEFFRKKLARRLLNSNSASDEHERSILSRLKQQCGAQFTSKVRALIILPSTCIPALPA